MKAVQAVAASDAPARWGYLAFVLTMLHLVRRARNKDVVKENMISFFTALLPTELAHKFLALNAGVVLWQQRRSKTPLFASWVGSIAGVVQCVVVLQLVNMYKSNVHAKHTIRDALATQSDIPPSKLPSIGTLNIRKWLSILLPLPQPMALSISFPGVHNIGCVVYAHVGRHKTTKLRMDVYKHATACKPNAPILLYIHGGGWVMGDRKNPPRPLIHQVASLGWLVCVIDYQLSPKVAFPTHLIDAKRAVAYLRQHALSQLQADPNFIVVAGESAGGHLASLVALTAGDKSLQPGFEQIDTSVRGCVDSYGVHDFMDRNGIYFYKDRSYSFVRFLELVVMQKKLKEDTKAFDRASPLSWVDDATHDAQTAEVIIPPFFIAHGTHDTLVPFNDSVLFYERLVAYRNERQQRQQDATSTTLGGVQDVFLAIPDAHHAFNYLVSPRSLAFGDAVCAFLTNLHAKTKHLPLSSSAAAASALTLALDVDVVDVVDAIDEDPLTRFSESIDAPAATTTTVVSRL